MFKLVIQSILDLLTCPQFFLHQLPLLFELPCTAYIYPLLLIKIFCHQPSTVGTADYCWTFTEVKVEVNEETTAEENSIDVASTEEQRLVDTTYE